MGKNRKMQDVLRGLKKIQKTDSKFRFSKEVLVDIQAIHGEEALGDIHKVVKQELKLRKLTGAGVPFGKAIKRVAKKED